MLIGLARVRLKAIIVEGERGGGFNTFAEMLCFFNIVCVMLDVTLAGHPV